MTKPQRKRSRAQRGKEEEILIWAGVVAQLNRTRSNRLLAAAPVPYPLFVLLRHFAHDPSREWTISSLTAAFETGQSGITKKVQKLLALDLLNYRADDADARMKWFSINQRGLEQLEGLNELLKEDQLRPFAGWASEDINQLHELLFKLKSYLDDHRD